jgi:hypothetical protein
MKVVILGTLAAGLVAGCGSVASSIDAQSEGDQDRDLARAVFLDHTVTDRLAGDDGDNTDWKYVDVVEQGKLHITVAVDRPDQLHDGEVVFYDEFGGLLKRFPIDPSENMYVFDSDVEKIPNKFYVRAFAKLGASAYTVGARLDPPPPPAAPVASPQPPPPPPPAPEPRVVSQRPTRPAPPRPAPPPPKPVEPAPPPPVATLSGDVVSVIPAENNQSVTIAIRLRGAGDVVKGAHGWVLKGGSRIPDARLTVLSVRGPNLTASVPLPPGKFGGTMSVEIESH